MIPAGGVSERLEKSERVCVRQLRPCIAFVALHCARCDCCGHHGRSVSFPKLQVPSPVSHGKSPSKHPVQQAGRPRGEPRSTVTPHPGWWSRPMDRLMNCLQGCGWEGRAGGPAPSGGGGRAWRARGTPGSRYPEQTYAIPLVTIMLTPGRPPPH